MPLTERPELPYRAMPRGTAALVTPGVRVDGNSASAIAAGCANFWMTTLMQPGEETKTDSALARARCGDYVPALPALTIGSRCTTSAGGCALRWRFCLRSMFALSAFPGLRRQHYQPLERRWRDVPKFFTHTSLAPNSGAQSVYYRPRQCFGALW